MKKRNIGKEDEKQLGMRKATKGGREDRRDSINKGSTKERGKAVIGMRKAKKTVKSSRQRKQNKETGRKQVTAAGKQTQAKNRSGN